MAAIESFARRHPAFTYYVLVFAISWGGILLLVGPGGIPGRPEQVARMMPIALIALFAGPSVAGLVCTALVHGRAGLRDLLARGLRWRVGIRGYATALLTAPLLVAAVLLGLSSISSEFLPGIVTARDKVGVLLFGIAWGLVGGGLLEELGWTGFAVPTLRRRHGPVATGLIVGFLWGVWHYLISFWASGTSTGALSLTQFLPGMVFYVASLPAYRVLMVWLHDRTKSLPLAMLMHASFSASMLILQPPSIGLRAGMTWNLVLAVLLWATVGAVALIRRGHLSRQPLRSLPLQEVSS
jgi:membrane protease YdiL (CAAX protease family)